MAWLLYYAGVVGPTIAAIACGGAAPVRRLFRWRVSLVWYVVAILLPFALRAVVVAAVVDEPLRFRPLETIARLVALMIVLVPFEEIGWRGYALPVLQQRWSPLASSVIVGVIWALWHLPLAWACVGYQQSGEPWSYMARFLVTILPLSCLMTWLFNRSGESVLIASLFHIAVNTADIVLVLPARTGELVLYGTTILGALLVLFFGRHALLHRR